MPAGGAGSVGTGTAWTFRRIVPGGDSMVTRSSSCAVAVDVGGSDHGDAVASPCPRANLPVPSASGCRPGGRATAQARPMPMAPATPIHRDSALATRIRRVRDWPSVGLGSGDAVRLGFGLDGRLRIAGSVDGSGARCLRRLRLRLGGRLAILLRCRSWRILGHDRGRDHDDAGQQQCGLQHDDAAEEGPRGGEETASLESPLSSARSEACHMDRWDANVWAGSDHGSGFYDIPSRWQGRSWPVHGSAVGCARRAPILPLAPT